MSIIRYIIYNLYSHVVIDIIYPVVYNPVPSPFSPLPLDCLLLDDPGLELLDFLLLDDPGLEDDDFPSPFSPLPLDLLLLDDPGLEDEDLAELALLANLLLADPVGRVVIGNSSSGILRLADEGLSRGLEGARRGSSGSLPPGRGRGSGSEPPGNNDFNPAPCFLRLLFRISFSCSARAASRALRFLSFIM